MLEWADKDGNGSIDLEEFLKQMMESDTTKWRHWN